MRRGVAPTKCAFALLRAVAPLNKAKCVDIKERSRVA